MLNFTTGLTGIRASQVALDTVAQNIANANTPGYHRQSVSLADRTPLQYGDLLIGSGVDVTRIRQIRNDITEEAITRNVSDLSDVSSRLDVMRRVESLLLPASGSLYDRLQTLMNELEQLSTQPDSTALRQTVVQAAVALADEVGRLGEGLNGLRTDVEQEVQLAVQQVNALTGQIAELNRQIALAEGRGLEPNDLWDRRDQLMNELGLLVDAQLDEQGQGHSVILIGQGSTLIGSKPVNLVASRDAAGNIIVTQPGFDNPIQFGAGKLAGLMAAHDQILGGYLEELDNFTTGLAATFDGVHATGIGSSGPFDLLHGHRGVSDITAALAVAGLAFPVQSGELTIGVTDLSTGQRTLHSVAVDPASDSLQDLAALISSVSHVQAVVDSQNGTLTILGEPGFAFDFTGQLETVPDASGITGTTTPMLHGSYTGTDNDQFVFEFIGNGTIGVTPGLQLEVRRSNGDLVATLDVGEDYQPGSVLAVADGVSISLKSGTAAIGDTFSTAVIADPDTAGVLTALGLNTLFIGSTSADIAVQPLLIDHPEMLATSRTGQPGEQSILQALIALRNAPLVTGGTASAEQFVADLIFTTGSEVANLTLLQANLESLAQHLDAERQSISGVDPNEELVYMLQFQRSFQASAQYIATLNETLDDLFSILR